MEPFSFCSPSGSLLDLEESYWLRYWWKFPPLLCCEVVEVQELHAHLSPEYTSAVTPGSLAHPPALLALFLRNVLCHLLHLLYTCTFITVHGNVFCLAHVAAFYAESVEHASSWHTAACVLPFPSSNDELPPYVVGQQDGSLEEKNLHTDDDHNMQLLHQSALGGVGGMGTPLP